MNVADKEQTEHKLRQAVADYREWLKANNYALATQCDHLNMLRHFQTYVKNQKIDWDDVFTEETFHGFRCIHKRDAASAAFYGLARYLFGPNGIDRLRRRSDQELPEVYEDYLASLKGGGRQVSPRRCNQVRRALHAFQVYLHQQHISLRCLQIADVDVYLKGKSMKSTRSPFHRCCIRGFLRYLYWEKKLLSRDLAPFVMGAKQFAESKPPKFLRPEEVQRLFAVQTDRSGKQLRRLAILHLAFTMGLRPKEISMLTLDDIAFQQGEVTLRMRKAFNPIRLPVPDETIKAIAAYLVGGRPRSSRRELFLGSYAPHRPMMTDTVRDEIKQQMKSAGLSASPYWLRHTYAQQLLEQRTPIHVIKELLGQDTIQTTKRYISISTSLMREVLFDERI